MHKIEWLSIMLASENTSIFAPVGINDEPTSMDIDCAYMDADLDIVDWKLPILLYLMTTSYLAKNGKNDNLKHKASIT